MVDDLVGDLYLAEDGSGAVVGMVSIGYTRLLAHGGQVALLDAVIAPDEPSEVRPGLIAFAEARAQQRGCRQLIAWPAAADDAVRAALVARGYRSREGMVRWFQEEG